MTQEDSSLLRLCRRCVLPALLASLSLGEPGAAQVLPECLGPQITSAHNARVFREEVDLEPGSLFSVGGFFEEKGADEPCDPVRIVGPYEVDSAGTATLTLTGNPPAPQRWSLSNSGVGVELRFEPRLGSGYGAPIPIGAALLGTGATEAEAQGSWSGPGRITGVISPARGAGPLTGSCFAQAYSATVDIVTVNRELIGLPGMRLGASDYLWTLPEGQVDLQNGYHLRIQPNALVGMGETERHWVRVPGGEIKAIRKAVTRPYEEYYDHPALSTWAKRDPSIRARWRGFLRNVNRLKARGYPMPGRQELTGFDMASITGMDDKLRAIARNRDLSTAEKECLAAAMTPLYLRGHAEDVMANLPSTAAEIAAIWLLPDQYDLIENGYGLLTRMIVGQVESLNPLIGIVDKADNILATRDALVELALGSFRGEIDRVRLEMLEDALQEGWSKTKIAEDLEHLKNRQDRVLEQYRERETKVRADYNKLLKELEDGLREIDRLQRDKYHERSRETWARDQSEIRATTKGDAYKPYPPGIDAIELTGNWNLDIGNWVSDAPNQYQRDRENLTKRIKRQMDALKSDYEDYLGHAFKAITMNAGRIEVLEKHIPAAVHGDCTHLREGPDIGPVCPPGIIDLVTGEMHYLHPTPKSERARIIPETPVIRAAGSSIYPGGTEFAVEAGETGAAVRVIDGHVTVLRPDGEMLRVESGQQMDLDSGAVRPLDPESVTPLQVNGLSGAAALIHSNTPEPKGAWPLLLGQEGPENGWVWQDPGDDATLEPGDAPGTLRITVPDQNDLWQSRADAPRLLRRVTGDFDLDLTLNLQLAAGNHLAIDEFLLYAPGAQLGLRAGQADSIASPAADFRLLGGGWYRMDGRSRLPVLNRPLAEGIEPPDDAEVQFRFSRRGDWFHARWSLDGERWTTGMRVHVEAPATLWAGMSFKRMAYDGAGDAVALTTLRDMRMTSPLPGAPDRQAFLPVEVSGRISPEFPGWRFRHDPERADAVSLLSTEALEGDFDAVLRVDLGPPPTEGGAVAAGLRVFDREMSQWVYIALSAGNSYGGRYQTHNATGGQTGRFAWNDTSDRAGWLRMTRKGNEISVAHWKMGRWSPVETPEVTLPGPLNLELVSWNAWDTSAPTDFAPSLTLERLARGAEAGTAYSPPGPSLLTALPLPDIALPEDVSARLWQAPFAVQSPFFDAAGNLYLLPTNREHPLLIGLAPDGRDFFAGESEAFGGLNRKRGLWQNGELYVSVDLWWDGGNRLDGVLKVSPEGSTEKLDLGVSLGGLSCLKALPDGGIVLCDFENDGLWTGKLDGGALKNLTGATLACPQDAALSGVSGALLAVNNGGSYSCDARPGLYRIADDGGAERLLEPAGDRELGGLVWTSGGLFGGGFFLVEPNRGALLRLDEQGLHAIPVLSGLKTPWDLAAMSDGTAMALMLDARQVLVLRPASDAADEPAERDAALSDPEQAAPGPVEPPSDALLETRLAEIDLDLVFDDPDLLGFAMRRGAKVYGTGCAHCHGPDGRGLQIGWFPNLTDEDWLWGRSLQDIYLTVKHGIRDFHDFDSRVTLMPSFVDEDILSEEEAWQVVNFVLSLSGRAEDPDLVDAGGAVFELNCAGCHRPDATGDQALGAPNLADDIWLGPGERDDVLEAVRVGPEHSMPAWAKDLSEADIRAVAIHVRQMNSGNRP